MLSIAGSILLFVFLASWYSKNKKIRKLEHELALLRAKVQLEKLAFQYETTVKELNHLKEKDEDIKKKIDAVEKSLTEKLSPDLTMDEIIEKFRSIGIKPGEDNE